MLNRDKIKILFQNAIEKQFVQSVSSFPKSENLTHVKISVEPINILNWLHNQPFEQKFYWLNRDRNCEIGAVGKLFEIKAENSSHAASVYLRMKEILASSRSPIKFFGGMRFNPYGSCDSDWESFGTAYFFLPLFELSRLDNHVHLIYNFYLNIDDLLPAILIKFEEAFDRLNFLEKDYHRGLPSVEKIQDNPSRSEWEEMMRRSLQYIKEGELQKIVLARRSVFEFEKPPEPIFFLKKLKGKTQNTFTFYLQMEKYLTFFGATPEQLYFRQQRKILSEAIAGTYPRGKDIEEDQIFLQDLLSNDKELREHNWVNDEVKRGLKKLCSHLDESRIKEVIKLSFVQHIYTKFKGNLSDGVSDKEILDELHPTPAVAGFPKRESLAYIDKLENFDRGWYAGPIGWVSADSSQFAVAIRSALLRRKKLSVFAGAGIVLGSNSEKEWQEIENKILNYSKILN